MNCDSPSPLAPRRNPRQSCEPRPRNSLLLDEHLEPFPHAFGMDQCLELQPRFRALGLALSFVIEIGKFISLPQRQQKSRLRIEPRGLQARSPTPAFERPELHAPLQPLFPGQTLQ